MKTLDNPAIDRRREDQRQQERGLVLAISGGNDRALEQLYNSYYLRLYRFVYRITRRLDLVEEVINDVMLVVWRKAETFIPTGLVSTWIFGIAYRKSLKHLEGVYPRENHVSIDESEDLVPGDGEAIINHIELENWLAVAFEQISPEQRAVMELTYYQGLSYGEIAEVMECPENTVKTRMFHARKRLKSVMAEMADTSRAL
jgi:RNA polymerase sigma-70 factor (ECF subfamily)